MTTPSPEMKILVVNCGSSSIKFQLCSMPAVEMICSGQVERIGDENAALKLKIGDKTQEIQRPIADHEAAMADILEALTGEGGVISDAKEINAVGHRVVHGGDEFSGSMLLTDEVIASIERFASLAPLHNPPNLVGIRAAIHKLPDVPQVACFDTAFHATIPEVAYTYALPIELRDELGVRRYGFHGTSHRFVARRAAELLGIHKHKINCITAHLGNGCSITAVRDGCSVDTSMGLTPLEGLVMGTRSGDFDPAILFFLADQGYDMAALNKMCNKQSGLLGISGESNDMRTLVEKAETGDDKAQLAIDIFCYRIKKYLGTYSAVLGRVDAIVFTGGIGENAAHVRAESCKALEELGIEIDPEANAGMVGRLEGEINTPGGKVKVLVIPTNEEGAIAADTYEIAKD
jgi:acetate kinase